jgi:hypothetical protein
LWRIRCWDAPEDAGAGVATILRQRLLCRAAERQHVGVGFGPFHDLARERPQVQFGDLALGAQIVDSGEPAIDDPRRRRASRIAEQLL